jgi:hypothetical protein
VKVRRGVTVSLVGALAIAGVSWSHSSAEPLPPPPEGDSGPSLYTGVLDDAGLAALVDLGVDRQEITASPTADGDVAVEVILTAEQAAAVAEIGGTLEPKPTASNRRVAALAAPVFRPYSGAGGIQEELGAQAAAHPQIARLEVLGQTVQGKDINAVRVTGNVARTRPGRRPTTVYLAAQHAREWITPEMVRRLLDYYLDGYGTDPTITALVDENELWFVPVANPDGYDLTFQPGRRLWRKNVRDNDGNGRINTGDGVDLNRNSATRWGYDNEGSSPNPGSDTYRGPSPASEPETQAIDALFARITPEFFVNYHSAAQLLLHGIGWQVATPSPDDVLYEAMVGDDADPAIPGYDPDISAELYTTNGDIDSHMQEAYGTLGFTPEMGTCASAADSDPDDAWLAEDCDSDFFFPDDEDLIQAEFEKNIPFALAVAESAADPDDPVSVVGIDTPNFVVDSFAVSYGDPQTVAVTAKRTVRNVRMEYRVNGGRVRKAHAEEWDGGERYGFENDDYYAELRGVVTGARAGDRVEVWFSGVSVDRDEAGRVTSEPFTYTVARDSGSPVLILANEDYTGVNPEDTPTGTGPKYLAAHVAAFEANGVTPDVWDVDADGVPHDLGILSHYSAVVWYLGDNRLTMDPEDALTTYFGQDYPDLSVAERQQYLTMAVRDFLNEGGKLLYAGETAGYYGLNGAGFGGIYYGLDGAPEEDCVVTFDPFSDCLLLADDFTQYYLGVDSRAPLNATGIIGTAGALTGRTAAFGGPATVANPIDEAGAFVPLNDVLDPAEFPWFGTTVGVADYVDPGGPFVPIEGTTAVLAAHQDDSYMRLARTFDLSGVGAAQTPTFTAQLSVDAELGYDHVIVEAHTVNQGNWTTLPDLEGGTTADAPAECAAGFLLEEHPNLLHYLTLGDPCTTAGTSGSWNSFTGSSGGWHDVAFDLSAYAGQQVEVVVSYVSDPFTGGVGAMIDDTALVVGGTATQTEGFETGLGAWSVPGAPAGSPGNSVDWERSAGIGLETITAGVSTADTVMFGFGLEQLETDAARAAIARTVLDYFGVS